MLKSNWVTSEKSPSDSKLILISFGTLETQRVISVLFSPVTNFTMPEKIYYSRVRGKISQLFIDEDTAIRQILMMAD